MSTEPQTSGPVRQGNSGPIAVPWNGQSEVIPDLESLVIEDDQPVDSIFAEKQQRLLTEPLYVSWAGPGAGQPFQAFANVGLFFQARVDGLAPDVMLVIGAQVGQDLSVRENRSYFTWIMGKPPDVAIEIVSDRRGREEDYKRDQYARIGVPYYVIFDPNERLGHGPLRCYELRGGVYVQLEQAWFPGVGLGLTLWQGSFEGITTRWLRWCDAEDNVILTGRERAEQEQARAEQEREKRERLEARLRALGVDPDA